MRKTQVMSLFTEHLKNGGIYLIKLSFDSFYSMEYDSVKKGFWMLGKFYPISEVLEVFSLPD